MTASNVYPSGRALTGCLAASSAAVTLDPAPLRWPAAVEGNWRGVGNGDNLHARRLQRANRHLSPRARSLDENVDLAQSMFHGFPSRRFRRHLRRIWSALAAPLEAVSPRAGPRDNVPTRVGHGDNRIVECRLNIGLSPRDVFSISSPNSGLAFTAPSPFCHSELIPPGWLLAPLELEERAMTYFFFRPPTARRGPRRVRAFVRVRCPRVGIPRRCRKPR